MPHPVPNTAEGLKLLFQAGAVNKPLGPEWANLLDTMQANDAANGILAAQSYGIAQTVRAASPKARFSAAARLVWSQAGFNNITAPRSFNFDAITTGASTGGLYGGAYFRFNFDSPLSSDKYLIKSKTSFSGLTFLVYGSRTPGWFDFTISGLPPSYPAIISFVIYA